MTVKKWLVPDVVDPVESVCVQINIPKDANHINAFWGALEQLSKAYNWEDSFADGSATAYIWQAVLDDAAEHARQEINCMIDCDDVEDCLDSSVIINVIEGDIVDNTTTITNNTTEITEITNNPADGNTYPDPPDEESEPNPACGAAYFVVQELRAFIVDLEASSTTYIDLFDALNGWLALPLPFTVSLLITVLTSIFDAAPSVLTDYDAQQDEMREYLLCSDFDKVAFSTFLRTLTGGNPIADYLDCVGLSAFEQWYTIGSVDLTQDCTSFICNDILRLSGDGNDEMAIAGGVTEYDAGSDIYFGNVHPTDIWRFCVVTYTFASPTLINSVTIKSRIQATRSASPTWGIYVHQDAVEILHEEYSVTGSPVLHSNTLGPMTVTEIKVFLQVSINTAPEGVAELTKFEIDLA